MMENAIQTSKAANKLPDMTSESDPFDFINIEQTSKSLKELSSKKRKAVSFDKNLRVILIPSIVDYRAADLIKQLWWTGLDYQSFQAAAYSEIKLLSVCEGIGFNQARQLLYQPKIVCSKKSSISNFNDAMGLDSDCEEESKPVVSSIFVKAAITQNQRSLHGVSSDGNLHSRFQDTHLASSMRVEPITIDEDVSLCVPVRGFQTLSTTDDSSKSRSRRGLRRSGQGKWIDGDVSMGLASALAVGLLLLPVVFGLESYYHSSL